MPHDRRPWLTLLIMIGVASSAASIGCIKPSNLRQAEGSVPVLTPAGAAQTGASPVATPAPVPSSRQEPTRQPSDLSSSLQPTRANPPASPAPNATDSTVLQTAASPAGPAPDQNGAPPAIQPGAEVPTGPQPSTMPAPPSATPPSSGTSNPDQSPSSTPLLDAEIRRVEDVTREHNESLQSSGTASLLGDPKSVAPGRPVLDLDALIPIDAASRPNAIMTKPARIDTPEPFLAEPAPLPIALSRAPPNHHRPNRLGSFRKPDSGVNRPILR